MSKSSSPLVQASQQAPTADNFMDQQIAKDFERVVELLELGGIAGPRSRVPCTPDDVETLRHSVGCTIPQAYELFLRSMGRQAGKLFVGTDAFFPAILGLNEAGRSLISFCNEQLGTRCSIPDDALVFAMHQGYQFFCMVTSSPNPPVFHFDEGYESLKPVAGSYTDFLLQMAQAEW